MTASKFRWQLFYLDGTPKNVGFKTPDKTNITVTATGVPMEIHKQGAVYVLALTGSKDKPIYHVNQVVQSNSVTILWQFPQIIIITAAEILFSITGYEFAYSQVGWVWSLQKEIPLTMFTNASVCSIYESTGTSYVVTYNSSG
ncbi:unnamed protein product [Cylicostephanus goldi]|uniref:Uncharacterized protein n=1 Tax=Cylicostephanus goldi TaxID=71465 RepID=A0A3P6TVJ6_CYLGO|nr:unnamed protein product [Cylicostephanus goldi]